MKITLSMLTIIFFSCGPNSYCPRELSECKKAEFELKIEYISNPADSRNLTLKGKDRNGRNIQWTDFSIWLNNNSNRLFIGDSIKKVKNESFFTIKNNVTHNTTVVYYECGGKIYQ